MKDLRSEIPLFYKSVSTYLNINTNSPKPKLAAVHVVVSPLELITAANDLLIV